MFTERTTPWVQEAKDRLGKMRPLKPQNRYTRKFKFNTNNNQRTQLLSRKVYIKTQCTKALINKGNFGLQLQHNVRELTSYA